MASAMLTEEKDEIVVSSSSDENESVKEKRKTLISKISNMKIHGKRVKNISNMSNKEIRNFLLDKFSAKPNFLSWSTFSLRAELVQRKIDGMLVGDDFYSLHRLKHEQLASLLNLSLNENFVKDENYGVVCKNQKKRRRANSESSFESQKTRKKRMILNSLTNFVNELSTAGKRLIENLDIALQ